MIAGRRSRSRGAGWTVIHAAIDEATARRAWRVAYVELLPDECGVTASGFPVHRVLTDDGSQYVSRVWKAACADLGVGARRTRPYRPQTNGKVKRWFQTVQRECLSLRPMASEDERQRALDALAEYQNHDRPHLGIKGLTPRPPRFPVETLVRDTTQRSASMTPLMAYEEPFLSFDSCSQGVYIEGDN